jgi:hypothetical protein
VLKWLMTTAGLREHGTTHQAPLARFEQVERGAMLPLRVTPYDPATWKQVTLHRDGYVVFEKAFYSAPCRLVGQKLWLRAGLLEVRLFDARHALVATHPRARQPGERQTQPDHLPAEKLAGLTASRPLCQARAQACGPATAQDVQDLLEARPLDKLRTALRVLQLAEGYTSVRLEAACTRGLHYGDTRVTTLRRILQEGLEAEPLPDVPDVPDAASVSESGETLIYARSGAELAQAILGGQAQPVREPVEEE